MIRFSFRLEFCGTLSEIFSEFALVVFFDSSLVFFLGIRDIY